MSKKYIQRGLVLALTLLLALAAFAVPAFADGEAPAQTSTAKTFTWTDNEPLVLNIRADEGFRMPAFFLLRINDAEYTVFTTGAENPEGITYDSSTGKLSVSPALIHDGDSFALVGSAVGVHVDAEGLTDIAVSADLGRDFSAAKSLELALTPAEGYVLPAELHLVINDILYTVYTDGTVYNDGVAFDPARGVLTVDVSYLKIGQTLTLSGAAVCVDPDKEAEQEQETDPKLYVAVDVTALENTVLAAFSDRPRCPRKTRRPPGPAARAAAAALRDNIGGDYPRLTYIKQTNNFQASNFWLRDGGYFKIQNIELGYNVRFRSQSAVKGLRVFLRGANLCTISGIKDVDPENINAGVTTYPLYRTFTAGFKFTF